MNRLSISKLMSETIYRTKIVQEFANNEHQLNYNQSVKQYLHFPTILRFGLFKYTTHLEQFTLYITHPQIYFIENGQQLEFSIFVFAVIQLFFLYWVYILYSKEENYIQRIKDEQESSTIKCIILQSWKYIFIFFSDWLGFLLIEGCFMIIYKGTNYFSIVSSIVIVVQILFIMALQDIYLYQSLYFLPLRKNQLIKSTPYIIIQKLLYLMVIVIYCSEVANREIILSSMIVFISILILYIYLIIQITIDSTVRK